MTILAAYAEMTDDWPARFHAGERVVLEDCYRSEYQTVHRAVGRVLNGADQETVVHEVFYRLLSDGDFRRRYSGGSLGAWLTTVARNQAIDFARRRGREVMLDERQAGAGEVGAAEARLVVDRFCREVLPPKWQKTFLLRFVQQMDRNEVAAALGVARTTVAYRELRIRALLRRFVLRTEGTP